MEAIQELLAKYKKEAAHFRMNHAAARRDERLVDMHRAEAAANVCLAICEDLRELLANETRSGV